MSSHCHPIAFDSSCTCQAGGSHPLNHISALECNVCCQLCSGPPLCVEASPGADTERKDPWELPYLEMNPGDWHGGFTTCLEHKDQLLLSKQYIISIFI